MKKKIKKNKINYLIKSKLKIIYQKFSIKVELQKSYSHLIVGLETLRG